MFFCYCMFFAHLICLRSLQLSVAQTTPINILMLSTKPKRLTTFRIRHVSLCRSRLYYCHCKVVPAWSRSGDSGRIHGSRGHCAEAGSLQTLWGTVRASIIGGVCERVLVQKQKSNDITLLNLAQIDGKICRSD